MSVPNPIPSIALVSDGLTSVTLSHSIPSASPTLLGFRYFRSAVSLADVQALAAADVVAGALNSSQPGLITDVNIQVIGAQKFSRVPGQAVNGLVSYADPLGVFTQYWYAAVAWNSAGASTVTTATVLHLQGAQVVSASSTDLAVSVLFNQNLVSTTGQPGRGFTVTSNGVPIGITAAVLNPDLRTVVLTCSPRLANGDVILVSFNRLLGDLASQSGAVLPVSFTNQAVTNASVMARLVGATIARRITDPAVITVAFTAAVAGDPLAGFSFMTNAITIAPTTAVRSVDGRMIRFTFAQAFQFSDEVVLSYSPALGSLTSGVFLDPISNLPVTNASKVGTPLAEFPLSSVIRQPLVALAGGVTATLLLDLNSTDQSIADQFGPATVDFGGVYGITIVGQPGYSLPSNPVVLAPGVQISAKFFIAGQPQTAAQVATEWVERSTVAINQALGQLRVQAEATLLGGQTVRMV